MRTVTEEDLSRALLFCLERAKLVVEPAGAAAVAALLADPAAFAPPVVAVLSGGNIDPLLLLKVIQHGMAAAGRYLSLRLRVPDRPGALAALLGELAAVGANVLEVEHVRTAPGCDVDEVEVFVVLETRGPEHADEVARRRWKPAGCVVDPAVDAAHGVRVATRRRDRHTVVDENRLARNRLDRSSRATRSRA